MRDANAARENIYLNLYSLWR